MYELFLMLVQRGLWIILRPLAWFFMDIRYPGGKFPDIKKPFIIASNHKHLLDPFIICLSLPFWAKVWPIRFMAEYKRVHGPILRFLLKTKILLVFYKILGTFPANRGQGVEYAIRLPLKLLKAGQSVLIFPEGRIIHNDDLGEFKQGVAVMALRSSVPVLPVGLSRSKIDKKLNIKIGEPFLFSDVDWQEGAKIIKEKIFRLYAN